MTLPRPEEYGRVCWCCNPAHGFCLWTGKGRQAMPELFPGYPDCNGSGAGFSTDRRYRYWLTRKVDNPTTPLLQPILWLMLNPSIADETQLDPTLRRCLDFTRRLGGSLMLVGNLYALVSTDPRGMAAADDPVGPRNQENLEAMAAFASIVIVSFGAHPGAMARARDTIGAWPERLQEKLHCLGTNQDGSPKHPLYLPKTAQLHGWELWM